MLMISNPPTGDVGLNPIVLVLFIVCSIIVIGCLIWAFFLNRKNSGVETTVITITDDEENETPSTIVEDIENTQIPEE